MIMMTLYTALLVAAWAAPSLLTLSPTTYGITTPAHFVTFLASVVLFILLGRSLRRRHRRRFLTGLWTGFWGGSLGTIAAEIIRHSPPARSAFAENLPTIPRAAADTMLSLHATASAALSALISGILFALLGATAVWWGGLSRSRRTPPDGGRPAPKADPST